MTRLRSDIHSLVRIINQITAETAELRQILKTRRPTASPCLGYRFQHGGRRAVAPLLRRLGRHRRRASGHGDRPRLAAPSGHRPTPSPAMVQPGRPDGPRVSDRTTGRTTGCRTSCATGEGPSRACVGGLSPAPMDETTQMLPESRNPTELPVRAVLGDVVAAPCDSGYAVLVAQPAPARRWCRSRWPTPWPAASSSPSHAGIAEPCPQASAPRCRAFTNTNEHHRTLVRATQTRRQEADLRSRSIAQIRRQAGEHREKRTRRA